MAKVDAELYEFLKETACECSMYYDHDQKRMVAYTHIYFWDLEGFVKAVGSYWFDEGGMKATIFENTICVELQDIFESDGNSILDYKKCFSEDDIDRYRKELEEEARD